jgi:hypothetical protein
VVAGVAGLSVAAVALVRRRWLLPASLLGSTSALLLVTGWLLADPTVTKADALKTGGLAGGAVLALHALWINDRRRRTEEARHEVELSRAQQDRDRIGDERFAKAIELLGHDADQVRVGGLLALAGLARSRPSYGQTVVDVLCSYLRRPFAHPAYELLPDDPAQAAIEPGERWPAELILAADRERQVRLTAQRLIADLLADLDGGRRDLDLSAASLEYLDLAGRRIGGLTARRARLYGITRLGQCSFSGPALFSGATFHGRTELGGVRFGGGLSLAGASIHGPWRWSGATVAAFADLRTTAPPPELDGALATLDGTTVHLDPEHPWALHPEDAGRPASGPSAAGPGHRAGPETTRSPTDE